MSLLTSIIKYSLSAVAGTGTAALVRKLGGNEAAQVIGGAVGFTTTATAIDYVEAWIDEKNTEIIGYFPHVFDDGEYEDSEYDLGIFEDSDEDDSDEEWDGTDTVVEFFEEVKENSTEDEFRHFLETGQFVRDFEEALGENISETIKTAVESSAAVEIVSEMPLVVKSVGGDDEARIAPNGMVFHLPQETGRRKKQKRTKSPDLSKEISRAREYRVRKSDAENASQESSGIDGKEVEECI